MNRRKGPGGRPFSIRSLPRRFIFVLVVAISLVFILILANPSHRIPTSSDELRKSAKNGGQHAKELIPNLYNPFADDAHKPPEQKGSNLGNTRWYNDWKWLKPFSSQVTLDDDRAVLPPLPDRPTIYTYYDAAGKTGKVLDAEHKLVLAWRRAWWAKGFRPVVLGRAEAQRNEALYKRLQNLDLEPSLKHEFERWLAWHYIGGGILANWLLLPMARHDDTTLPHLRRGEFNSLIRFNSLGTGLFCGMPSDIKSALNEALETKGIAKNKDFLKAMPRNAFSIDENHEGFAYYDLATINEKYVDVAKELSVSQPAGLESLYKLINAHSSLVWQNQFSSGIAVLKSFPKHMTTLAAFAVHIGQTLTLCQDSPMPRSCPPNRPSCKPCDPDHPLPLSLPSTYVNNTKLFTLGTVAHPMTFNALVHMVEKIDVSFIRRKTERDQWLNGTTLESQGAKLSGPQRLVTFKEAVAGKQGMRTSLWFTAEREDPVELEWILGFDLPESKNMESPIDLQARLELGTKKEDSGDAERPSPAQLAKEKTLMSKARAVILGRSKKDKALREMVEAWNLADTEAWRFVKALGMRRNAERMRWEEEEKRYAGAQRKGRFYDNDT